MKISSELDDSRIWPLSRGKLVNQDSVPNSCLKIMVDIRDTTTTGLIEMQNFFRDLPVQLPVELFTTVLEARGVRIERIVSHGHCSPGDFWYDQPENEWVLVLQGAAQLELEHEIITLNVGDHHLIPAHQKHRVVWTTPDQQTIWLAVFYPVT